MPTESPITIVGNAVRDPSVRFSQAGLAILDLAVAVNHRKFNKQTNDWDEEASFFDVVAFGDLANNVSDSLVKGNRVIVSGTLKQERWENEDGETRSRVRILADAIGPDLRWATADVTRTEKQSGNGKRSSGGSRQSQSSYSNYDEEPF